MKKIIGIFIICTCLLISIQQMVFADQYEALLKSNNYQKLLSKGLKYGRSGENEKAVKLFERAIEIDPNNTDGYAGKIFFLTQDQDKFVDETIKKFPDDISLRYSIGMIYAKQNNIVKAIKQTKEIIELDPSDYKAYKILAELYLYQYDYKSAINVYEQAEKVFPRKQELYFLHAKACGDIENYKCSLENAEKLVKLNPKDPGYYSFRATYKMITNDLDGALVDIDKVIELSGKETANTLADKADVYYRKGDIENAKKYLIRALKKDINNQTANGILAIMSYENERYETTIKAADKCLKYNNGFIYPVRYWKTMALYKLERYEEAANEADYLTKERPDRDRYIKLKDDIINKRL